MSETKVDKQVMDIEFLNNTVGNDAQFRKELFEIFVENSNINIEKLEKALLKRDDDAWYMASHALKGASSSIGAFALSKVLDVAQSSNNSSVATKEKILEKVKEEYELVIDYVYAEVTNNRR